MFYILATKCYLPSHSNVFSPNNSNPVLPIVSAKARALYQKPCVSKLTLALTPHCSLHIIVWNYVCGNASCVPPAMLAGSLVWQKVEIIWNKYYYTKYIYILWLCLTLFFKYKKMHFLFLTLLQQVGPLAVFAAQALREAVVKRGLVCYTRLPLSWLQASLPSTN